jgi:hypothetical protein
MSLTTTAGVFEACRCPAGGRRLWVDNGPIIVGGSLGAQPSPRNSGIGIVTNRIEMLDSLQHEDTFTARPD